MHLLRYIIIYGLIGIFFQGNLFAAPEKIYDKVHFIRDINWYKNQAVEWEGLKNSNPKNETAWLNFFKAHLFADSNTQELSTLLEEMAKAIPNSGTLNYCQYLWDEKKAYPSNKILYGYQVEKENTALFGDLVLYYASQGEKEQREAFAQKVFESNLLSPNYLNYFYNVLMSVGENGYLVTHSKNTYLPLQVLQDVKKTRNDVKLVNLNWLNSSVYQDFLVEQLGLNSLEIKSPISPSKDQFNYIIRQLVEDNPEKDFYFGLSMSSSSLSQIKQQLYLVGLASQYSPERIDNLKILQDNFENKFLTDYLKESFYNEPPFSTARILTQNYLSPIYLLSKKYQSSGELEKAQKISLLGAGIAEGIGKKEVFEDLISTQNSSFSDGKLFDLEIKELEKKQKQVDGNLYASAYELTNKEYNIFLYWLNKNNMQNELEKCKVDLSHLEGDLKSMFNFYHKEYKYNSQPEINKEKDFLNYPFSKYPIINISYEAAILYCEWLTDQYNRNKKRKFEEVKFRLPNLEEWRLAALGHKGNTYIYKKESYDMDNLKLDYPWWAFDPQKNFGGQAFNEKGCYLGNFKVEGPCGCPALINSKVCDGFSYSGPVGSYFSNKIGLYDVVGNIAEMIEDKGKACGGSWGHLPENSKISDVMTFEGVDERVGVRIFMEVIKE
ncbi:formylglycine-generating enzyme family protein [Flexithrix dorotheae]|uniref:formylglycine-generating enzyme family protein n=1 Tax=Flexithrix dorotheae TaxID=70993 RepID=UPI00036CE80F|nr:SUMF1/EgtB/PvdO family nonheme iron enzyme [Flexithrix dorotheae]